MCTALSHWTLTHKNGESPELISIFYWTFTSMGTDAEIQVVG